MSLVCDVDAHIHYCRAVIESSRKCCSRQKHRFFYFLFVYVFVVVVVPESQSWTLFGLFFSVQCCLIHNDKLIMAAHWTDRPNDGDGWICMIGHRKNSFGFAYSKGKIPAIEIKKKKTNQNKTEKYRTTSREWSIVVSYSTRLSLGRESNQICENNIIFSGLLQIWTVCLRIISKSCGFCFIYFFFLHFTWMREQLC